MHWLEQILWLFVKKMPKARGTLLSYVVILFFYRAFEHNDLKALGAWDRL